MAPIDPIYNGEGGAAVRAKLTELIDTVNSGSTTINVGDAPLYDPLKAGGYEAGSIVSYKNESSPDEGFQEFAIYLALTDIPQGVGPEDSTDWKNEGATVEVAGGNTANGVVQNITRLRELTGMRTGHTVAVQSEGAIYAFDEGSESGTKPFAPGIGSWRKRGALAFANIARVFTQYDAAEGDEVFCPLLHTIINFAQAGNVTIVDDNGEAARNIVSDGPCVVRRIAAPFVLSSFEVTPLSTLGGATSRSYSIDLGTTSIVAQEINMFGDAVIDNIVASNVASILLSYSGGLQEVITPGENTIAITAGDILTWEITRTNAGQLATLGIHLSINE